MDKRIEAALELSNRRQAFDKQLSVLKARYKKHTTYAHNGGLFYIDQELVSFVSYLVSREQPHAVLIDDNDNPILVENLDDFLTEITSRYMEMSMKYYSDFVGLRKSTDIEGMIGIHEFGE